MSREDRKAGRRAKQVAAMEHKAADEARYFWTQVDAGGVAPKLPSKEELFGNQSTGINFAQRGAVRACRRSARR